MCLTSPNSAGDSQDESTLWSLSREYFEAACVLNNTPPTVVSYSGVVFYLLGHSAELALKSYLHSNGESISSLRDMGHNLKRLVKQSKKKGLSDSLDLKLIEQLSNPYMKKRLEYRINSAETYPNKEVLIESVKSLIKKVFDHVSDF